MIKCFISTFYFFSCIHFYNIDVFTGNIDIHDKVIIGESCDIKYLKFEFFSKDSKIVWKREINNKKNLPSFNRDLNNLHDYIQEGGYFLRIQYQLAYSEDTIEVLRYCAIR